jgi:hypothetical protein
LDNADCFILPECEKYSVNEQIIPFKSRSMKPAIKKNTREKEI